MGDGDDKKSQSTGERNEHSLDSDGIKDGMEDNITKTTVEVVS